MLLFPDKIQMWAIKSTHPGSFRRIIAESSGYRIMLLVMGLMWFLLAFVFLAYVLFVQRPG